MNSTAARTIMIVTALFSIAACGQSVHRVESSNYGYAMRKDLTVEEVRPVIERVTVGKGWALSDVRLGGFVGKREWGGGKHSVAVTVTYAGTGFSIVYKDSTNMAYNGSSIHHAYNEMVVQLEEAIKVAVSLL